MISVFQLIGVSSMVGLEAKDMALRAGCCVNNRQSPMPPRADWKRETEIVLDGKTAPKMRNRWPADKQRYVD